MGPGPNVLSAAADEFHVSSQSYQDNHQAVLSIPAHGGRSSGYEIPCLFENLEGKRLRVELPERPPARLPIGVQYNDVLFIGEVIASAPTSAGMWKAEILVEEMLNGLQSLMNLRSSLLGTSPAVRPASVPLRVCA